jgi:regulator of sirC expression with transglutaminase-like and TPR domain
MGRARFAELMAGAPGDVQLDEACLLIAARLRPDLDVIEWLAALDMLAGECPTPTADGVARHLFDAEHFGGNRRDYYDWRNSCLDRVIATRQGIPITLSIVMIEVARRLGVRLVGIGMPAHFLVGVADDDDVYFDPFDGGRRLDRAGARRLFEQVTGGRLPWDEAHLDPTPNREIVIRTLNNLKGAVRNRGDVLRFGIVMKLRGEVAELAALESTEIDAALSVFN